MTNHCRDGHRFCERWCSEKKERRTNNLDQRNKKLPLFINEQKKSENRSNDVEKT